MTVFEFYDEDVKELYMYIACCPNCKSATMLYVNEKGGEHGCSDCGTTHILSEEEFRRRLVRE